MKTTQADRVACRMAAQAYRELEVVGRLLDDFEETARQLEDARDRLQVLQVELGSLRRQLHGGAS